jgi:tagaturonate epimerase
MRQLIHVGYKLAALKIDQYNSLLEKNEEMVAKCVFENMYDRHISRVFLA